MENLLQLIQNNYLGTICGCTENKGFITEFAKKQVVLQRQDAESDADSEDSEVDQEESGVGHHFQGLSYIAEAAETALSIKHPMYEGVCWNVTHGRLVGEVVQSPPSTFWKDAQLTKELENYHSDDLPKKMFDVIVEAEYWVDFASLGVPDGKFLLAIVQAIKVLAESGKEVTLRFLTGNIIGMPIDNQAFLLRLVRHPTIKLPSNHNLKIWVGSWRKNLSWNHSKIVAADGKHLFTGGHNVWDAHYLQKNPVRDISIRADGQVAEDAHVFLNRMWSFIIKKDCERIAHQKDGSWIPKLPKSKTSLAHWPSTAPLHPPVYIRKSSPLSPEEALKIGETPMITLGRYGCLHHSERTSNPSDTAIAAMLATAKSIIRMSLQDLGPMAIPMPTGPMPYPGCRWPTEYFSALGQAMCERGVTVQIALSNPFSIPADLSLTEAQYGNGWSCDDVASEILKCIIEEQPHIEESALSAIVENNLQVTYMRASGGESDWPETLKTGNHSKCFIVDDLCFYVGSQNLYIANLGEWGVVVDDAVETLAVLEKYWNPMWEVSYESIPEELRDCCLQDVFEGVGIDRTTAFNEDDLDDEFYEVMLLTKRANHMGGAGVNLVVWLRNGTNIATKTDFDGSGADIYVLLSIEDEDGHLICEEQQSKCIENSGHNPEWNETFEFEGIGFPDNCSLHVQLFDKDSILGADALIPDDFLGSAKFGLNELKNSRAFQDTSLTISCDLLNLNTSTVRLSMNTRGAWGS